MKCLAVVFSMFLLLDGSLSFLDYQVYSFHQTWKIFIHYFFRYFFINFLCFRNSKFISMRIIKVFRQLTDALLIVDECVCFFYVFLLDSFYCCIFKSISLHLQCLIGHYYHLIHVLISDIIVLFTEVQFGSFLYLSWPLLNFWDTGNTVIIIFMSFFC